MENVETLTTDIAEEISTQAGTFQLAWEKLRNALPFSKLLSAAILLIVCLLVMKVLLKAAGRILDHSRLEKSLHSFLRSTLKALLLFITLMIVAGALGINTSSLLAVLSVAGLAISLSIQNSLSNLAGGVMILTAKPFKVDDYIKAGGVEGTVREIGIIYTKLATIDNCIVHVPNSSITSSSIVNYSAEPSRRMDMEFSASYDCPIPDVKAALAEAVDLPQIDITNPPQIYVKAYGESAITYLVRAWAATPEYWDVYYTIMEAVKASFDRHGIEMTYPHLNVHICQTESPVSFQTSSGSDGSCRFPSSPASQ